jgi:hypothetical protein
MKKQFIALLFFFCIILTSYSQERNTITTDANFSLEGALFMFRKSATLKIFEDHINAINNNLTNLDLNNDGYIDFINVNDIMQNNTHTIVLSTYINEIEKRDIAAIIVERTGNETALITIKNMVEMQTESSKNEPTNSQGTYQTEVVNAWLWPCVQYLFASSYQAWISPYHWALYPAKWKTATPLAYDEFYSNTLKYKEWFNKNFVARLPLSHIVFTPQRNATTVVVNNRGVRTVVRNRCINFNIRLNALPRLPVRRTVPVHYGGRR